MVFFSRKVAVVPFMVSLALGLCLAFLSTSALAQSIGVSITPATIEPDEQLIPGNTYEFSFTLQNLNAAEQTFYFFTRNISDVKDGGTPVFANANESTGYELADWISLATDTAVLAANATQEIKFTVAVPGDATPGSHFGGVFVSVDPPDINEVGAAVGYQVANLVIVRVEGETTNSASIRQFSTDRYFHGSQNVDFSVVIENEGNVLVRPTGPLEVFNMLGQKVDTITFNENQNAVLPGKTREFLFNWQGEGVGFGRYEAILSSVYGDDGEKKTMSSTVAFWVLPMNIIGPALGVLAAILLLTFIFVRMYIKRTLAGMSMGGSRVIRRRKQSNSATFLVMISLLTVTSLFLILLLVIFA